MAVEEKKKRKSFLERLVILEESTPNVGAPASEEDEMPRMMFARRRPKAPAFERPVALPKVLRIEMSEPEPVVGDTEAAEDMENVETVEEIEEITEGAEPEAEAIEEAAPREIPVKVISEREHERRAARESYFDILGRAKTKDDEPVRLSVQRAPKVSDAAYAPAEADDSFDDMIVSEMPAGRTIDPEDLLPIEEKVAGVHVADEAPAEIRFVVERAPETEQRYASAEPEPASPADAYEPIVISSISDLADLVPAAEFGPEPIYTVESTVPREEMGVTVETVSFDEISPAADEAPAYQAEAPVYAAFEPVPLRAAIDRVIFPEHYFYAKNGAVIKTFAQLHSALQAMDDETWGHHARERGVNDFANWVKHVFEHIECAERLQAARDRKEMLGLVAEYL